MSSYSDSGSSSSGARARAFRAEFPVCLRPVKEVGLMKHFYCGASAIIETSKSQLNPGRRFYTCPNVDDGECHIWKWWDVAVTKELDLIDGNYGSIAEKMDAITFKADFYETHDKIEQLKEARLNNEQKIEDLERIIAGIKKKRAGLEMQAVVTAAIVLVLLLVIMIVKHLS